MDESLSPRELAENHCREGFNLAWVQRNPSAALKEFRKALEVWPDSAQAHCQIGQIYLFAPEKNLVEALKEFRETTRLAPDWGEGHLCCGGALRELRRFNDAEFEYRQAARLMPADPRAYIWLGDCMMNVGKYPDAIAAFQQGISFKPHYGEMAARMMLADAFIKNGQIQEAREEWKMVASMKAVWDYERKEPQRAKKLLAKYS